ncbi:MAG: hypothetical protein ACRETB_08380 [Steroidobacteraceae bacterium]
MSGSRRPSREETLRELLARVHEHLSHAGQVDPESRALLMKLMQDIGRMPGGGATRTGSDGTAPTGTGTGPVTPVGAAASEVGALPRLEALAVRFETEHPALGQGLRQLVDFLSNAGI